MGWFDDPGDPQGAPAGGNSAVDLGNQDVNTPMTPGATFDGSWNSSDPAVSALQKALQMGLSGPSAVAYVQKTVPGARITWDQSRGNYDLSTGGSNGLQFDTNASGVWGVHSYNDAGMPGGGGFAQGGPFPGFTPPSYGDFLKYPGLQFGLDQGLGTINKLASAKGVLNSGGTLKALSDYATNYGLTKYGDVFNQALAANGQNFNINQGNFGNLYNLGQLGLAGITGATS